MPIWILALPSIVKVIIEITKFIMSLKDKEKIKECSEALKEAKASGSFARLRELLKRLDRNQDC